MANNRFNMQVTPKGYKMGGRAKKMGGGMMMQRPMMQRPMMEKGGKVMEAAKAAAKRAKDKRASDRMKNSKPNKKSGSSAADVFKSYGKYDGKPIELKDGGVSTEIKRKKNPMDASDMMERRKKQNNKKLIEKFKKAGSPKFSKGGSALKPVQPNQKGLKKLPTEVRNKMGFMKKGGVVSDTKKKQFKANQAGQKATNKKAMKVAKGVLNVVVPAVGASEIGKKIARKFKGDK